MKEIKIKVHWSFFVLGILMLIYGKFFTFLCCLFCVLLHEMGHSIVGKHLGYKLNLITLLPYGAMLSGQNNVFSQNDEIKIAIAGPLVNAVLIVIAFIAGLLFPAAYDVIREFAMCNIYTLCFNMLPVYPMDGGRILMALLSKKITRTRAAKVLKIVGYVIISIFFLLFFISYFYKLNYMLGINALFMLIGLFGEDNAAYYEKLTTFDQFRPLAFAGKIIKLDKSTPIFVAYKKLMERGASQIYAMDNQKVVKKISRNAIISKILVTPIDTSLENIN